MRKRSDFVLGKVFLGDKNTDHSQLDKLSLKIRGHSSKDTFRKIIIAQHIKDKDLHLEHYKEYP